MTEDAAHTLIPQVYAIFEIINFCVLLLFLLFNIDVKCLGFWMEFGKRRWFIEIEEIMESKIVYQRIGIF